MSQPARFLHLMTPFAARQFSACDVDEVGDHRGEVEVVAESEHIGGVPTANQYQIVVNILPPGYEPVEPFARFNPADVQSIISRPGGQIEEIWIDTSVDHVGNSPVIQSLEPGSGIFAVGKNALVALHRLPIQKSL